MSEKKYKINVDTRILELLGPNLYTNIYYVLAELIANAYDASAKNVYIISKKDKIIIEDDGKGMSYKEGGIAKYLNIAQETRKTDEDAYTSDNPPRRKMGRKGVGKLAALSVSSEVHVKTVYNGEKSGFILSRQIPDGNELNPIPNENIVFEKINEIEHGTAIVMNTPHYSMHKSAESIKRNLLKIFPLVNERFQIHIITPSETVVVKDFNKEMIQELACINLIGEEFFDLDCNIINDFSDNIESENFIVKTEPISDTIKIKNKAGEEKTYPIEIKGWIGSYKSTRGRKASNETDFPDNFVSLFANGKLGEFNVIPLIGKNNLSEVYVVGQLHCDLFEETELPDMALSNRQGYKSDDPRYVWVKEKAAKLLEQAVRMRTKYVKLKTDVRLQEENSRQQAKEEELRATVMEYTDNITNAIAKKININRENIPIESVKDIIENETNTLKNTFGLKGIVDKAKKKILISQTAVDKALSDVIYKMLLFNDVPKKDILYTNGDDIETNIPYDEPVYEYLRKFFVESVSTQMIYVIYVTSDDMAKSWGCVLEAGAGWITKQDYDIFNINEYAPKPPLNNGTEWHNSKKINDQITMDIRSANIFVDKIINICSKIGYTTKDFNSNKNYLETLVDFL